MVALDLIEHPGTDHPIDASDLTLDALFSRIQTLRMMLLQRMTGPLEADTFTFLLRRLIADCLQFDGFDSIALHRIRDRLQKFSRIADANHRLVTAYSILNELNSTLVDSCNAPPQGAKLPLRTIDRAQLRGFVLAGTLLLALLACRLAFGPWYMEHVVFPNMAVRLTDLAAIRGALESFRATTGKYPVSSDSGSGWVGIGRSDSPKDWIPALVPKYLASLPVDPRRTENPYQQYAYRSDGADYKLLSLVPEDCAFTIERFPALSDPARNVYRQCFAYGYWSARAATW